MTGREVSLYYECQSGDRRRSIRLYLGDCMQGMQRVLQDESVDLVVTSPPYNIGIKYGSYQDHRPREEYLSWIRKIGCEIRRALRPHGSFFLNVGNRPSDPWIAWDVASSLRDLFVLQNLIHWVKAISLTLADVGPQSGLSADLSIGHYKPISSARYLNDCHEFVFHFTKRGDVKVDRKAVGVPYQDKSNVTRWKGTKGTDLRCRGNVWFLPYETVTNRSKDRPHPATFPVRLAEMCIRLHGLTKRGLVLDPFVGIGSTALACLRLGVGCVGFEVDREYLSEAARRLKAEPLPL